MSINRGWYPDLQQKNRRRYWDGDQWGPPRLTPGAVLRRVFAIAGGLIGGLIVLFVVIALVVPTGSTDSTAVAPAPRSPSADGGPASRPAPSPTASGLGTASSRTGPSTSGTSTPGPSSKPGRTTKSKPGPTAGHKTGPAAGHTPKQPTRSTPAPKAGTALAVVSTLTVKGRAPKTGYSRNLFGAAWSDVDDNGCRQRDDVLNRDLTDKHLNGCVVLSGTLRDPYTGSTIHFHRGLRTSTQVQIDHVVALSDAWQKGAQQWSIDKRREFANDTLNLLAVGQSVNESKGDGDTATWLPPKKSYRCAYVARQVAVKKAYALWVTPAERTAMVRILSSCPDRRLPARAAIPAHPAAKPTVTKSTPPQRRRTPTTKSDPSTSRTGPDSTKGAGSTNGSGSRSRVVHPGAFCAPVDSTGVTSRGTPMVCSTKPGDPRARWRSGG